MVLTLLFVGCALAKAEDELAEQELREENARLRAEVTRLRVKAGEPPLGPEKQQPKQQHEHFSRGNATLKPNELNIEKVELLGVFAVMVGLCAFPMVCCKSICHTKLHVVYPFILVLEVGFFCYAMNYLYLLNANYVFFTLVDMLSLAIEKTEQGLIGIAGLCIIFILWKFKDRLLETLGIENPAHYLGEPRDWATCWSMKRFQGIELIVWKAEDLPSAKVHASNDVFCEVRHGYNPTMRTRVHNKAGNNCIFKETMQLNFDPFDHEGRFFIAVRNQDVFGASDIGQVQLGVDMVQKLIEPGPNAWQRSIGWAATNDSSEGGLWANSRFRPIDLIPAGRIYVRILRVDESDADGDCCGCCWPSSSAPPRAAGGSRELGQSAQP
jgi:hypothetical protein